MDGLTDIIAQDNLLKAFNYFGVEATLEKIEHLYKNMPTLKEHLIKNYYILIDNYKK